MPTQPQLGVRIAVDLAEFKANLLEGRAQIEALGPSVAKLGDTWTAHSTKLVSDANNITAAIHQIGAGTLTAADSAKNLKVLDAAMEHLHATGKPVPALMQETADSLRKTDTVSSGLTDTFKQLALGFAAMFTARAAMNFVKDTFEEASALKDLSQQTHINVVDLQVLAGAMSEFGVDADTLGKGLYTLSRKIAAGDDSVEAALQRMGIGLKEVQGLNGKELFLKIMDGLATLQGGMRDDTSAEIFGSRLGMAMAGASEGIRGAIAAWEDHNTAAGPEATDAMDKTGESITRMEKSLSAMAANMIGPVADDFNTFIETVQKAGTFTTLWARAMDIANGFVGDASPRYDALVAAMEAANKKTDTGTGALNALVSSHGAAASAVGFTRKQMEELDKAMEKEAERVKKEAKETADIIAKYMKAEHDLYFDMHMFRLKNEKDLTDAITKENLARYVIEEAAQKALIGLMNASNAERNLEALGGASSLDAQLEALAQTHQNKLREIEQLALQANAQDREAYAEMVRVLTQEEAFEFSQAWDAMVQGAAAGGAAATGALSAIKGEADQTSTAIARVGQLLGGLLPALSDFSQDNRARINADYERGNYQGPVLPGGGVDFLRLGFPTADRGGPVSAGQPYLIGRGAQPELFVPSSAGTMYPSGSGGGSTVLNIYVTQPFGTPDAIGNAIIARQKALGVRFGSGA